jgi:hypothetical protein
MPDLAAPHGYFCLDCGANSASAVRCTSCPSEQVWPLRSWLNRQIPLHGLVHEACRQTGKEPREITDLVQRSWPGRYHFSQTQVALVVNHIQRKGAQSQ